MSSTFFLVWIFFIEVLLFYMNYVTVFDNENILRESTFKLWLHIIYFVNMCHLISNNLIKCYIIKVQCYTCNSFSATSISNGKVRYFKRYLTFLNLFMSYKRSKSGNHQLVIKWPIGDFELGNGVFRIWDWGFQSPIIILKSPIPNLKSPIGNFITILWFSRLVLYYYQS